jgi:photosystem II stability/assembly factor-like uncharacterized protein
MIHALDSEPVFLTSQGALFGTTESGNSWKMLSPVDAPLSYRCAFYILARRSGSG